MDNMRGAKLPAGGMSSFRMTYLQNSYLFTRRMPSAVILLSICLGFNYSLANVAKEQHAYRPKTDLLSMDHDLLRSKQQNPHDPEQVHISLAGAGAVAVSWVTNPQQDATFMAVLQQIQASNETGNEWLEKHKKKGHHSRYAAYCKHLKLAPLNPTVQFGSKSAEYDRAVEGSFSCYSSYEYASGALHHVVIGAGPEGPLLANTTYFFRCGDPSQGWSEEFSFTTPLAVSKDSFPFQVALVGDLGQTDDSFRTLKHMQSNEPSIVVNVGDLSYADGFQPRWDSYGRLVEPFAASLPWMVIEGNHEKELIDGVKDFTSYDNRYYTPSRASGSESSLYYSFESAGVHFIMLGSYAPFNRGSEQYKWLSNDLRKVDRHKTPWLVVTFHAPWYNSNTAHYGEGDDMQASVERLLFEHGVDLVVCGHVHAYERMHRVFNNQLNECGPIYVNIGDGGNWEGLDTHYLPQPEWSAFREPSFGHAMLTFHNGSVATLEWHRNDDGKKVIGDSLTFSRTVNCNRAEHLAASA